MVKVTVDAGVCGFVSKIEADSSDGQNATVSFSTDCPNLKPLEKEIKTIDGFSECFGKISTTESYKIADEYVKHPACPVPCGIVKAVEAACGLALPKSCSIVIEKD
jgi:hypothetical protein